MPDARVEHGQDQADNTTNTRKSYLKFDISGVPSISSAKLRLFGGRTTGTTQAAAYSVENDGWTESGITWNNRPAVGNKQGSNVVITTTQQYYEFDVTAFTKAEKNAGNSTVSLVVLPQVTTSYAPDTFNSREAASDRPQLVVTP